MNPATDPMPTARSSLDDPRVRSVLDRLYSEAGKQLPAVGRLLITETLDRILGRTITLADEASRLKDLYVPLTPKQGILAYSIARSIQAKRIVEFGTSFGISTIHLAAAVRDNGAGLVVGTEMQPRKATVARDNLAQAGLADYAEIREGDAQETLVDPGGPVDMVLLDGFKDLYLPVLKLLVPSLRRGAVVLADNIFAYRRALRSYVAYVQDRSNGFSSVTLYLGTGTEYSVRL